MPIPGSKRKQVIYPKAPVEQHPWSREEWLEQFLYVQTQLEVLVQKYLSLTGYGRKPVYTLRMVGTSPSNARPSIVVMCRDIDLKDIAMTFRSRAEKELQLERDTPVSPLRQMLIRRNDSNKPVKPRLRLVYFQTKTLLSRKALNGPVAVGYTDHDASCGSLARFGDTTATVGIALALPQGVAFLTVDHLFGDTEPDETLPRADECLAAAARAETPMPSCSSFDGFSDWEDEDEYELLDTSSPSQIGVDIFSNSAPRGTENETDRSLAGWRAETWERMDLPRMLDSPAPFLDWALINPEKSHSGSPPTVAVNTVYPPSSHGKAVVLRDLETSPPAHLVTIYVISGIRGILHGELITAPAYIPSPGCRKSCEAWTVLLENHGGGKLISRPLPTVSALPKTNCTSSLVNSWLSLGFVPGECGSTVVDSKSNKVYGHIVASDPLGSGYVVPLARTIDQISTCLETRVALVDPLAVESPVETGHPVLQQGVTIDDQRTMNMEKCADQDNSPKWFPCPFALRYPGAEPEGSPCNELFCGLGNVRYVMNLDATPGKHMLVNMNSDRILTTAHIFGMNTTVIAWMGQSTDSARVTTLFT